MNESDNAIARIVVKATTLFALVAASTLASAEASKGYVHRSRPDQTILYSYKMKFDRDSSSGEIGVPADALGDMDEYAVWAQTPLDLALKAALYLPGDRVGAGGGRWERTRAPWRLKDGGNYAGELAAKDPKDREGLRRIKGTWKFDRPAKYDLHLVGAWPVAGELEINSVFDVDVGVIVEASIEGTLTYPETEATRKGPKALKFEATLQYKEILDPSSPPLRKAVDDAVKKAIEYLKKQKPGDGYGGGARALMALALLHADVPLTDSSVTRLINEMRRSPLTGTYANALGLMVLDAATEPEAERKARRRNQLVEVSKRTLDQDQKRWSRELYAALKTHMGADGTFHYSPNEVARGAGDYSNTQYGLLGMISARRMGLDVAVADWQKLAGAYLIGRPGGAMSILPEGLGRGEPEGPGGDPGKPKDPDDPGEPEPQGPGGKPEEEKPTEPTGKEGEAAKTSPGIAPIVEGPVKARGYTYLAGSRDDEYGSMTAAGLAACFAIRAVLPAEDPLVPGLSHSIETCKLWIEENWTVRGVPPLSTPHAATRSTTKDGWGSLYFLYAIERAGMLGGLERFGEHSWYEEGAWALVGSQNADGSWGAGPIDTAFGVLFLVRSTPPAPTTNQ